MAGPKPTPAVTSLCPSWRSRQAVGQAAEGPELAPRPCVPPSLSLLFFMLQGPRSRKHSSGDQLAWAGGTPLALKMLGTDVGVVGLRVAKGSPDPSCPPPPASAHISGVQASFRACRL